MLQFVFQNIPRQIELRRQEYNCPCTLIFGFTTKQFFHRQHVVAQFRNFISKREFGDDGYFRYYGCPSHKIVLQVVLY